MSCHGDMICTLLLGDEGRIQWETLVAGLLALGAAVCTIRQIRSQIRLTSELAADQRLRRERAARAMLPLALSEFADYAVTCIKHLQALQPYFHSNGALDPRGLAGQRRLVRLRFAKRCRFNHKRVHRVRGR